MAINIHFFRNNTLDKLDFGKVLEFFDELPNFEIYYTANDVEIVYTDKEFQFSYSYLITKVSQVRQIYKLNPAFVNVNFLLQLPILVPEYVVKEILTVTQRLCKLFELEVFNDAFEDVKPFNLMDIIMLFKAARRAYIEENGLEGKILFDTDKLNSICKYQRSIDNICEWYHHEVQVDYCEPVIDRKTGEYGICCVWNIGIPTVFPPYFDYVKIKDEDDQEFMVRRKDFFTFVEKFLSEMANFLPDMYVMKTKAAHKSRSAVGKLKKFAILDQTFVPVRICDLIDDDKYQMRGK